MPSTKRKVGDQAAVEKDAGYERMPLEGGGFKRRRVGAKQWQWYCQHGKRKECCKECGPVGGYLTPCKCFKENRRARLGGRVYVGVESFAHRRA